MAKGKAPEIQVATVSDLKFDLLNANKGSETGKKMHKKSIKKFGAGRSILIDAENNIIAGNKTTEQFAGAGLQKVVIVDADPDTLVAVRRKDVLLDSPKGREMAIADNAVAKANIVFDAEVVEVLSQSVPVQEWNLELPQENAAFMEGMDDDDSEFTAPINAPNLSPTAPKPEYQPTQFPTGIMVSKATKTLWEQYRKAIKQPSESVAFEILLKTAIQQ